MAGIVIPPRRVRRTGDETPARSLARYVWRMSGLHQISICLVALIVAALTMVPLELQRRIINEAVSDRDLQLLALLGGFYLVVILTQAMLKFALRIYQAWLGESAIRYNRGTLARIHRGHRNTDGGREGRAVSIIGGEIEKLGSFVGEGISEPASNAGMLLAIGGYMLVVEPIVAAFSLIFLVPQALLVPVLQRRINRLLERRVSLLRSLSDNVTRLRGRAEADYGAIDRDLDSIYGNRFQIFALKFAMKALSNVLTALAPLSVLMIGGYLVHQDQTTIGVVVAFISGFERLSSPLRELLNSYRVAAQADVQHRMIARWM